MTYQEVKEELSALSQDALEDRCWEDGVDPAHMSIDTLREAAAFAEGDEE